MTIAALTALVVPVLTCPSFSRHRMAPPGASSNVSALAITPPPLGPLKCFSMSAAGRPREEINMTNTKLRAASRDGLASRRQP